MTLQFASSLAPLGQLVDELVLRKDCGEIVGEINRNPPHLAYTDALRNGCYAVLGGQFKAGFGSPPSGPRLVNNVQTHAVMIGSYFCLRPDNRLST